MATHTHEMQATIRTKYIDNEMKRARRDLKSLNSEMKRARAELGRSRSMKIETKKAQSNIKKVRDEAKRADSEIRKERTFSVKGKFDMSGFGNIGSKIQDMVGKVGNIGGGAGGIGGMIGKLKSFGSKIQDMVGKVGNIGGGAGGIGGMIGKLKSFGPAVAVAAGSFAVLKKSYDECMNYLNRATDWVINKIISGFSRLKDITFNATIKGFDEFSDYKGRANTVLENMDFKEYNKLMYRTADSSRSDVKTTRDNVTKLMQMAPNAFNGKNKEVETAKFYEIAMKMFRTSGASNIERESAMYQLSQGLASNVLQGDELRSIRENAPMMAQAIEKEVGMSIKKAGAQGLLTAEVVKNAILKHGDEINEKFKNIPLTFADGFTKAKNIINEHFLEPMYDRMSEVFQNEKVQNTLEGLFSSAGNFMDGFWRMMDSTNFGGIDLSNFVKGAGPAIDSIRSVYDAVVNNSPEAQQAMADFGNFINQSLEGAGEAFRAFWDIAGDIFNYLREHPETVKNVLTTLASVWKTKWAFMEAKMQFANQVILPLIKGICDAINSIVGAAHTAADAINALANAGNNPNAMYADSKTQASRNSGGSGSGSSGGPTNQLDTLYSVLGKRAMGQWTIPRDNTPIYAHEGEMLLTKREARAYKANNQNSNDGSNIVINVANLNVRQDNDIDKIASALAKRMRIAREGGVVI